MIRQPENPRPKGLWVLGMGSAGGGTGTDIFLWCLRRELDIHCELRFTCYFGNNSSLYSAKLEQSVKLAFFFFLIGVKVKSGRNYPNVQLNTKSLSLHSPVNDTNYPCSTLGHC